MECRVCGEPALSGCGKCSQAHYCCETCQRVDWPRHEQECAMIGRPAGGSAEFPAGTGDTYMAAAQFATALGRATPQQIWAVLTRTRLTSMARDAEVFRRARDAVGSSESRVPLAHQKYALVALNRARDSAAIEQLPLWAARFVDAVSKDGAVATAVFHEAVVEKRLSEAQREMAREVFSYYSLGCAEQKEFAERTGMATPEECAAPRSAATARPLVGNEALVGAPVDSKTHREQALNFFRMNMKMEMEELAKLGAGKSARPITKHIRIFVDALEADYDKDTVMTPIQIYPSNAVFSNLMEQLGTLGMQHRFVGIERAEDLKPAPLVIVAFDANTRASVSAAAAVVEVFKKLRGTQQILLLANVLASTVPALPHRAVVAGSSQTIFSLGSSPADDDATTRRADLLGDAVWRDHNRVEAAKLDEHLTILDV